MSRVLTIVIIWILFACLRTDEFKSTWRQFEPGLLVVQTLGRFFDDCVGICKIVGSIWDDYFYSDEVVSSRGFIQTEYSHDPNADKISELREILDELDDAEGMLDDAEVSCGKVCSLIASGIIWQVSCRMYLIPTEDSTN